MRIHELVRERTLRGRRLDTDPILMVGFDCNREALEQAEEVLEGGGDPRTAAGRRRDRSRRGPGQPRASMALGSRTGFTSEPSSTTIATTSPPIRRFPQPAGLPRRLCRRRRATAGWQLRWSAILSNTCSAGPRRSGGTASSCSRPTPSRRRSPAPRRRAAQHRLRGLPRILPPVPDRVRILHRKLQASRAPASEPRAPLSIEPPLRRRQPQPPRARRPGHLLPGRDPGAEPARHLAPRSECGSRGRIGLHELLFSDGDICCAPEPGARRRPGLWSPGARLDRGRPSRAPTPAR